MSRVKCYIRLLCVYFLLVAVSLRIYVPSIPYCHPRDLLFSVSKPFKEHHPGTNLSDLGSVTRSVIPTKLRIYVTVQLKLTTDISLMNECSLSHS